jgi:hypothetical protein
VAAGNTSGIGVATRPLALFDNLQSWAEPRSAVPQAVAVAQVSKFDLAQIYGSPSELHWSDPFELGMN